MPLATFPIWSCFPDYSAFGHVFPFSSFGLVFPFFFAWPCFPIFPLLALSSHFSSFGLVFPFFLFWPVYPIFPYFGVQCYIEWSVGTFCQLMDPEIGSCYITNTKLLLLYCTKKWEGLVTENRYVDNILSKKFKPFSSHILEIYFEKLGFTSTFGQTC